jgi:hypothetical protein
VKEEVPEAEGVPEIAPEAEFKESPPGSEPEARLQLYGVVPPEAERVAW